jgi:hypothetical protein
VCDNSLSLFSHQNIFYSEWSSFLLNALSHFISVCDNSLSLFPHQNIFSCAWCSFFLMLCLISFLCVKTPSVYFLVKTSFLSAWYFFLLNTLPYFISVYDSSLNLSTFSSKHLFLCMTFLSS